MLLAGQFTDVVEWSSGAGANFNNSASAAAATQAAPSGNAAQAGNEDDDEIEIEHFYSLVGEDGKPVDAYRYDLRMADALYTKAGTYTNGETVVIKGDEQTRLVTWLDRDGGLRHE